MGIILAAFFSFVGLTDRYQEVDGAETYLHSETIIANDNIITNRIATIKKGKLPFTYHLLVVEGDEIVIDIQN